MPSLADHPAALRRAHQLAPRSRSARALEARRAVILFRFYRETFPALARHYAILAELLFLTLEG